MLTNGEIATTLRRVAAVFEVVDHDRYRSKAYQNAANSVENLTISAKDLWEQGKLDEIPGVGEALSSHLSELFNTGKVRHFDHELKRVPQGMFPLMTIRGVGPKMAFKIAKAFKLDNEKTALDKIKKLIKERKLEELPGFGSKLQQKIRTSIESKFSKKTSGRLLLSEALPVAEAYIEYIKHIPGVVDAEPLGSLRRHVATVGDIDLALSTDTPEKVMAAVLKYPQIDKVMSTGGDTSRVKLRTGHEIDIKMGQPKEWGSLLHHYTGSKLHNIALRSYSLEKNLSISEEGIKNTKTNRVFRAKDEKELYTHLGLPFIPIELREGEEELEFAKKDKIPTLVEVEDIKGDLHVHSDFDYESSHDLGRSSLSEILDKARELSYEYIGFSDHNPRYRGMAEADKKKVIQKRKDYLLTQYVKYEKTVKTRVPKVLIGLEVDIRSDGELAISEEILDTLDYAIASVHSNFDLSKDENTKRLIKALSHPKVALLGHPTGRMLNKRNSIEAGWQEIFEFCKNNHKVLEVNASPNRLDLPDDLIKMAIRLGNKVCIDTDSHDVTQLDFMKFGVWTARRGWCTKQDVVNTSSFSDLKKVLRLH